MKGLGDSEGQPFREQFLRRLPARIEEIQEAWHQVLDSGWAGEPLLLLHRLAHSLAGASAMFGLPAVTATARELELLVKDVAPGDDAARRIMALIGELRRASADTG